MLQGNAYSVRPKGWAGAPEAEFTELWTERSRVAAAMIASGSRVLDLGCGRGLIRQFLPEGCTWEGYDLRPTEPSIRPINLDAGEFPEGQYDVVLLMGVLGWLKDADGVLLRARGTAPRILTNDSQRVWSWRRPLNFPSETGLEKLLARTDLRCTNKVLWKRDAKREYYVCAVS